MHTDTTIQHPRSFNMSLLTLMLVIACLLLAACSTTTKALPPTTKSTSNTAAKDIPINEEFIAFQKNPQPASKRGNPKTYTALGKRYWVKNTSQGYKEQGLASWYGSKFHGRPTSSGEPFDMHLITAAHKSLPIPTYVRVTRLDNGRSIIVKINDRGPFIDKRIIDLSYAAADKLDMVEAGTIPVEVVALAPYQQLDRDNARTAQVAQATKAAKSIPASKNPKKPISKKSEDYIAELLPPTVQLVSLSKSDSKPTQTSPSLISTQQQATYLHIGTFSLRRNAEYMRSRLREQLGYPITIVSAAERVHKLQLGPIAGQDQTIDTLKFQLAQLGLNHTNIIRK